MSHSSADVSPFIGPISDDWTIEELLDWFAEDDHRLSDDSLRTPLLMVEEALTGQPWAPTADASFRGIRASRSPGIVSLVRSIAMHSRAHPAIRAYTLAEVVSRANARLVGAEISGA